MAKIRNGGKLARSGERKKALLIAEAGLEAIDTRRAVTSGVRTEGDGMLRVNNERVALSPEGRLFVVGVGKCALDAAAVLESVFGDRLSGGVVLDVRPGTLARIQVFTGTHPMPTDVNITAAREIVALLKSATEKDTIVVVVSGGGSTLLCLPEESGCVEERMILEVLIRRGAAIQEVNTVRKHLSLARGGYLAYHAYPAQVISLIFSDVPGNELQFVASGPTVRDTTVVSDAEHVLEKYNVLKECNLVGCGLVETPKEAKYFERVSNILFVSNITALTAMQREAQGVGYAAEICDTCLAGEARAVGVSVAEKLHTAPPNSVLLYGGETTVTIRGRGKGGRNQELALAALEELRDDELILALASDGWDNSDHAGALCDILTRTVAVQKSLHTRTYLDANDSYPFFRETGDFLDAGGSTGSNIADLLIALKR